MRLWSVHPKYLDSQGLVALWREALLAQAVLRGRTRGYRHHPQLERFRLRSAPLSGINAYLYAVYTEACERGYRFDKSKIGPVRTLELLPVSRGQLEYEWAHLLAKLRIRAPLLHRRWLDIRKPMPHPLFRVHRGNIAGWERLAGP